jgi:hypothetical protein
METEKIDSTLAALQELLLPARRTSA